MFSGVFWGLILVLWGISIIIKVVFNIDLPVIRILFAILLIYWGLKMLFGVSFKSNHESKFTVMENGRIHPQREYNIIFGKDKIDLSNLDFPTNTTKIEIDVVMGKGIVHLNPEVPIKLKVETVLAEARLPEKNLSFWGDTLIFSPAYQPDKPYYLIELDVVMGNAEVTY
jgi:predicted membrane protein